MSASATRGGGLNRYFSNLLRVLPATGIDSIGYVAGNPIALGSDLTNVHSFAPTDASIVARLRGARVAIRTHIDACDIFVSHFAPYAFPALDLIASRPLVVHFHGPWKAESLIDGDSFFKASVKGLIEKAVYARGRKFIVLSRAFGTILAQSYGVLERDIRVIPGGVETARFETAHSRAASRERIGWPQDRPIVLSVRRLVKAKGLENFVEAAARVVRSVPDVLFLIAGTGPLAQTLQRAIDERALGNNVRLCGFISEETLPAAYAAADLFVVPTIALEGFGLVVIESLAAGTPVLVTPVGGLPEVVCDLDERLIFAGLTPDDIARGIVDALVPSGARPLPTREECRAYARRFAWKNVAARVANVYREVT